MGMNLAALAAAGLMLSVGAVNAAPPAGYRLYVASVSAQAGARLANAGVTLPNGPVKVRGVLRDGQLDNVRLVQSTGDLNADRDIQQALRRLKVGETPADLSGREVILTLGAWPIVEARAH